VAGSRPRPAAGGPLAASAASGQPAGGRPINPADAGRPETRAAVEAARAALPLLRERAGAAERQDKAALDYATATDVAVERLLIDRLTAGFPDCGVLAEESGPQGSRDRFWVLDPICGTINYAIGLPIYNVNVALVEDGQVAVGVLLEGDTGDVAYAEAGQPAWLETGGGVEPRRLAVSDRSATVALDFGHRTATGEVDVMLGLMERVLRRRLWNVRVLASSVVLSYVAAGRLAAHVVDDINPWDMCAGALIAQQAGATITDFAGQSWRWDSPNLITAATPAIHAQLLQLLEHPLP
jgi:myo-inositol-1(or 4)-monophosphatase